MVDLSTKEQARLDWLANGISTAEMVKKYGCHIVTAQNWIKEFSSAQAKTISDNKYSLSIVTPDNVQKLENSVRIYRKIQADLESWLESHKPKDSGYSARLKELIVVEQRISKLTGTEGMVDARATELKEHAKQSVLAKKTPPSKTPQEPMRIAGSGPVVPIDEESEKLER